jgi:hypothetical protein
MRTSICFIHDRANWYLKYVINQAVSTNEGREVVLIGSPSVQYQGCCTVDIEKYKNCKQALEFSRVYQHMSPNSYEFESFCFLRWFYLLAYMCEFEIDFVVYLDSDSLLFSKLDEIMEWIGKPYKCGYLIPEQSYESNYWVGSGNASYWTREMLQKYCAFILQSYVEKKYLDCYMKKWKSSAAGGICDMTAMYLFWLENGNDICNLATSREGAVFDLNINTTMNYYKEEYMKRFGIKKIQHFKNKPVFLLQTNQEKIIVHVVHFQGMAKVYIPKYYNGKYFKGKIKSDLISLFARILEFVLRLCEKMTRSARERLRRYMTYYIF